MHRRSKLAAALGLLFLTVSATRQTQAQVDVSAWPQVRVEVLAVNPDGGAVPGVTPEGVLVRGLGKPRAISALEAATAPQSVCILVDASNLDRLAMVKSKAHKLIMNLAPEDEVCVAAFAAQLWVPQEFTTDRRAAIKALDAIQPSGGTQLRDSLLRLTGYMSKKATFPSRAVVVFSDGVDHHPATDEGEFKAGLEQPGSPVIHFVCLPEEFGHARAKQSDPHQGIAFQITGMTGGLTYFPHTMGDMNGLVEALPEALRTRYILTFTAENAAKDGHEERLQVVYGKELKASQLRMLAPEGFYAPAR